MWKILGHYFFCLYITIVVFLIMHGVICINVISLASIKRKQGEWKKTPKSPMFLYLIKEIAVITRKQNRGVQNHKMRNINKRNIEQRSLGAVHDETKVR